MHITALSTTLMGLVALTFAAPHANANTPTPVRDLEDLAARGLMYLPKRNNKNNVEVIDTTFEEITEVQQGNEVELTTLVEKKLVEQSQKRVAKDNIRKNHFASKNNNVNTVITVVTEIIDSRSNEQVTRLMTHQVKADNGASEDVQVQVTEIKQLSITANDASRVSQNAPAQASSAAGVQQIAQNSPLLASNNTIMLPPGAAVPSNGQIEADPAAILEENQATLFVSST